MHYRNIFIVALLATACGRPQDPESGIIGNTLSDSTSLFNAYGVTSNTLFVVDNPTDRILEINIETMAIGKTFGISKPHYEHTLASHTNGAYVIDFSTKHLEIIRSDGSRDDRFFAFQGTPVSAAYNPVKGILAMQDDLQSVGLLMLSDKGETLKSWLGGPLIGKEKSLLAGDIDSNGRLILAVSDKSVTIVDIEKSIDGSAWNFESFDTAIDDVNWLAPDNEHANLSLSLAKDAIAVLDVQTKAVNDKIVLTEKNLTFLGKSKFVKPHILVSNSQSGRDEIYYIAQDGKLTSQELPRSDIGGYSVSYLAAKASELTVLFSKDDSHRVSKLRLSDNLVVFDQAIRSKGDAQLGPDGLFINKKSHLGYLQSYNLISNTLKEVKGYNFDYLRNN